MTLIEQAQKLAHDAHDYIGQKRKYTGEPYWVHTDDVVNIARGVLPAELSQTDIEFLAGLHLHDYREDVVTELLKRQDLTALDAFEKRYNELPAFSRQVVMDLTDVYVKEAYPDLNRGERKRLECERIGKTMAYSKTGKLADLISNTKSIVEHDKDFAKVYLKEKLAMLGYLADGSPILLQQASSQVIAGFASLGLQIPQLR